LNIFIKQFPALIWELIFLPNVTIRMSGDDFGHTIFRTFTRPHPRLKLIQNKRWGAALLSLPDHFEEYLQGNAKENLRRKRKRCLKRGFKFATIEPLERLGEILDINLSLPERQGRAMDRPYVEMDALRAHFERHKRDVYGVLDPGGQLKAYADVVVMGELAMINRLMGHGEELENGIMYLLISEVVRVMSQRKAETGAPIWLHYDTLFGGSAGLRYFKERLGFRPYRVRWKWMG